MKGVLTKIGELIDEISMGPFGSDIKVDSFVDFGVPVLNGANVSDVKLIEDRFNFVSESKAKSLKKANAKRGDIVITHRGTLGQVSYIPHDSLFDNYVISQSQFRVRLNTKLVDPRYFTYYFHSQEGQKRLLSFKNHVGVPALAQATTNFRLLEFPLIPLTEQQRVADILCNIDSKISLNNRINAETEAMAKTIYDYWFVQFDFPISKEQAKAMGKPKLEGKPYKANGGKMVWSGELKREVPEGWEVVEIGNILSLEYGKPLKQEDRTGAGYPVLGSNGVVGYHREFLVEGPGIVVGRKGTAGAVVWEHENFYPIDTTFFVRDKTGTGALYYHYHLLLSLDVKIKNIESSSAVPGLNRNVVYSINSPKPPVLVLSLFNDTVSPMFSKIALRRRENQKLSDLRDWLLPMLMNGQVKIKETAQSKVVKPQLSESKPTSPYFYQTQLVAAIVNASKKHKITHGEMTLAKYTYLVDKLYGVPTHFNYERLHLGPYPKEMKKIVNNKKFFKIQNNEVSVVPQKKEYKYEFQKQVEEAVAELASLFNQYKGQERSHQTELLATVCKVVEDIKSTDLKAVRESMKNWPIKLKGEKFKNKAEKFGEEETMQCLNLLKNKGWDLIQECNINHRT
jgi:type I restriction enzyme S subunit